MDHRRRARDVLRHSSQQQVLRRGEGGFTLVEVVVVLAIVLVLASVIAPSLIGYADERRAQDTAAILSDVATGLVGANGFRSKLGSNAGRVSQLTNRPTANNAAIDDDSCGGVITGPEQGNWDSNAPFVGFMIPRTGLVTPLGIAEDTMSRNPNNNVIGVNQIVFKSVDLRDVLLLDAVLDAGDGAGSGVVRWNTSPLVMFYRVTLDNKC
jgi:prepilin-type N-terminal cleavage/methylation domain-containing protein